MSDTHINLEDFYRTHKNLEKGEAILDVRRPDEFAEAHIEGALNIPVDEVEEHADELRRYQKLYIHCKKGGRAKMAFEKLSAAGLNNLVCVHDAGMDLWLERGYPVQKG